VARLWLCLVAGLLVTWSAPARAAGMEDKRECVVASEEAQLRRINRQLRGARDQLLICARDICPPLVKHDCDQWLAEVDASMPTIVISALDAQGHDVGDVSVRVDDQPFLEKLDGNATPIDPGEHTLRLQHSGDPPILERVIVREGEKNRVVPVHLQPPVPVVDVAPPVLAPQSPERTGEQPPSRTMSIVAYSLLGAGAVAIGTGLYFEVTQANEFSTLEHGCSVTISCHQSDVNTIATDRIYGGVSLATGIAAAGAGTVLLLMQRRPRSPPSRNGPAAGGTWFDVTPTRGGGAAALHMSF
jgi:hypothetical protein